MEDDSQDLRVLFSKPITYSSWGEEKQNPPSCVLFFCSFCSSYPQMHPLPAKGEGQDSTGKNGCPIPSVGAISR
jgi:hypothetical protein